MFLPAPAHSPDSQFSSFWDISQLFALLYVAYAIPLRVAFEVEVVTFTLWFWVDLLVDVYFIADMFLNFRTAYWDASGVLVVKPRKIYQKYLRSWFLIDAASSLPINYAMLISGYTESGQVPSTTPSSARGPKTIRLLRLGKLLRLARLKRMFQKYQDTFDFAPYLRLVLTVFVILFASHLMSCIWYMIGIQSSDWRRVTMLSTNGTRYWVDEEIVGWAKQESHWCGGSADQKGTCATLVNPSAVGLGVRYSRSLYNIFDKNNVNTAAEAVFAVVSEIIIGFIYGGLAGVMSSLMMSGGSSQQAYMTQMMALKAWMKQKHMPKRHRAKITAHFENQLESGAMFDERDILEQLPVVLSSEISYFLCKFLSPLFFTLSVMLAALRCLVLFTSMHFAVGLTMCWNVLQITPCSPPFRSSETWAKS